MATKKTETAKPAATEPDLIGQLSAENLIKNYVIASVGASAVPVPMFDIAAVAAIQLRMIQKLSQLHGQPFSERAGRNVITALAGSVFGYGAGFAVAASAVKIIPVFGWMIGMASLPLVSGASTYAVGRSLQKHFEDGGSLFDFSADGMRAYYQEQFEKGKEMAAKAKDALMGGKAPAEDVSSAA
jgi:uncharacterized protein (DUF697 family)